MRFVARRRFIELIYNFKERVKPAPDVVKLSLLESLGLSNGCEVILTERLSETSKPERWASTAASTIFKTYNNVPSRIVTSKFRR